MSTTNATSVLNATSPENCSSFCPEPPDDSSNEFSVENVVGIFLTLSLCLLTQPYGSLFYNPPSSKSGQRLFFTWRMNPLACIAETAVTIVSLALVLRLAMQDPEHNTLPTVSRRFPFYHATTERSRNWRRHWHVHAAALLLIRANEEGSGGGVLDRLMAESLLRDGDSESAGAGLSGPGGSGSSGEGAIAEGEAVGTAVEGGGGTSGSGVELTVMERAAAVDATAGENNATPAEAPTTASASASGAEDPSEPQPGVLRRRTSQLEVGLPVEPSTATGGSGLDSNTATHEQDRLADLRKVLGNNVLAHKEKWVHIVTSFSVLGVAIKLAATTLPWTVRVPAAFFLAGWSSVQFLLYLFHLGELDESSAGTVVKTIRLHRQLANDTVIHGAMIALVTLVVAPPVIWLGYRAGFPTDGNLSTPFGPPGFMNSTNTTLPEVSTAYAIYHTPAILPWMMSYMMIALGLLCVALSLIATLGMLPMGTLGTFQKSLEEDVSGWVIALLTVLFIGVGVGGGVGCVKAIEALSQVEGVVRFFNGLIGAGTLIATSGLLFGLLIAPCRLLMEKEDEARVQAGFAFFSTLLSLYLFGELVCNYNSEGTYKPAWLEYLG